MRGFYEGCYYVLWEDCQNEHLLSFVRYKFHKADQDASSQHFSKLDSINGKGQIFVRRVLLNIVIANVFEKE